MSQKTPEPWVGGRVLLTPISVATGNSARVEGRLDEVHERGLVLAFEMSPAPYERQMVVPWGAVEHLILIEPPPQDQ